MPDVTLLVADKALHTALLEQLVALPGFKLIDAATPKDAWAGDAKIVILEKGSADIAKMQAATPKTVFVCGDGDALTGMAGVEIFARPFYLGALLDRIAFHKNIMPRLRSAVMNFGVYRFEPQNRQMTIEGVPDIIRLTEKETALLEYLAQSDKHVPRDTLLAEVWGYGDGIDTHTLETHIYHLRRKLNPDGTRDEILCNDNQGYFIKGI